MIKRTLPSVLNHTPNQSINNKGASNMYISNQNVPSIKKFHYYQDQSSQRPTHIQIINSPNYQDNKKKPTNSHQESQSTKKFNNTNNISRRKRIFNNDGKIQYQNYHKEQSNINRDKNISKESQQINSEDKIVNQLLPKMHLAVSFNPNLYTHQKSKQQLRKLNFNFKSQDKVSPQKIAKQSIESELKNKIGELQRSVSALKQQIQNSKPNSLRQKNQNLSINPFTVYQPPITGHPASPQIVFSHSPSIQISRQNHQTIPQPQIHTISQPQYVPALGKVSLHHTPFINPPQILPTSNLIKIPVSVTPLTKSIQRRQSFPFIQNSVRICHQKELFDKCMRLIEQNQKLQQQLVLISAECNHHKLRHSKNKSPHVHHIYPRNQQFYELSPIRKKLLKPYQTCSGIVLVDNGGDVVQNIEQPYRLSSVSPIDLQKLLQSQDYRNYRDVAEFTRQIEQNDNSISDSRQFKLHSNRRSRSFSSPSKLSIASPLQLHARNNILIPSPQHRSRILMSSPRKTANFAPSNNEIIRRSPPSSKITPIIKIKNNQFHYPKQTVLNQPILAIQQHKFLNRNSPVKKRVSFNNKNPHQHIYGKKDQFIDRLR